MVDELAKQNQVKWTAAKARADVAAYKMGVGLDSPGIVLAKSHSYMNESGGPIKALANFYKVDLDQIIVIHDELDIPFAAIRTKLGGGDNGHNGLKSLTSAFNNPNYFRVRMGIGRPIGEQDPSDFVLKNFASAEKKELSDLISRGAEVVESIIQNGLEITQAKFNS
ncbi:MAG: hypothetical protein RL448_426 [Actinomycetota bacterium]